VPGKDHSDYYYVRFSAYAELQGEQIDIAGVSISYTLNQIPMATIYPTVGREPQNNKEAKAVDKLLAAQPFTPVKIYAKFETDKDNPSDEPGFPIDEDTLLFDGYITGVTYQTTRSPAGGSVSLSAGAMGWLAGLRGTSAQTTKSTVKGPGGFAEAANLNNSKFSLFDVKQAFATDGTGIVSDLWIEFIKPFFYELIDTESVWGDSPNDSADSALGKMDDEEVFSGDATNQLPLTFGEEASDIDIVKEYVGQGIGKQVFYTWRNADLWSALQGIAFDYKFAIVPLIETASCVPVYGALNGKEHRYITTNDYHSIMLNVRTPVKVVKVVITGTLPSSPFSPTPITSAIVGLHSAESAWADPELGARGQTIALPAPQWLTAMTPIGFITRDSVGSDKLLIPDAVNPTANVKVPEKDYQDFYNNYLTSDLGDRYAKTIAQHMLFEERSGTVDGRFRLDVGPGSLVKVQVIDDKFAEEDAEEKAVYGQVQSVTLTLQAGRAGGVGTASTSFFLKYVRTAQEHEAAGDALTASAHPLYDTRFVGVKLWSA
jgi:hypothetical protein